MNLKYMEGITIKMDLKAVCVRHIVRQQQLWRAIAVLDLRPMHGKRLFIARATRNHTIALDYIQMIFFLKHFYLFRNNSISRFFYVILEYFYLFWNKFYLQNIFILSWNILFCFGTKSVSRIFLSPTDMCDSIAYNHTCDEQTHLVCVIAFCLFLHLKNNNKFML